jgi:uncharacterized protein (DUF362 family)
MKKLSRRDFMKTIAVGGAALGMGNIVSCNAPKSSAGNSRPESKPVVSVVKIKNDNVDYAVRQAIDLLGGIKTVSTGKERIMLKPNLVNPEPRGVTKLDVIKALAQLMKEAGKDVSIGEGSATAGPNFRPGIFGSVCRTKDIETLDNIQQIVFDRLGYSELEKSIKVPLVNLHIGEMSKVSIPNGFVFEEISIHHSLTEIDMLCSVPMMKTHGLAAVTLGMKNLIGVYPGEVYGTVRSAVHSEAAKVEESGTASAIVDMVRANKMGLVVIDASVAMQGQGPSVHQGGQLVKMDLIIAGTNPLATDMAAAYLMGFHPEEIATFVWAWKAGMTPVSLSEIEIRGEKINDVKQNFVRPTIYPWDAISQYGPPC